MFDKVLKVGATCDWITPTVAFIQDFCNGPAVHIGCPYGQGWSAVQIKQMLTRVGIKVWGLMVVDDRIIFSVRRAQARYAFYWLDRAGLPYTSSLGAAAPRGAPAGGHPAKNAPRPAQRRGRGLDGVIDGIASLADRL